MAKEKTRKRVIWKIAKHMFLIIVGLLLLLVVAVIIFVKTAPQMGQKPSGPDLQRIAQSAHHRDGEFVNLIETSMGSFGEMMRTLPDFFLAKNTAPEGDLPVRFKAESEVTADTAAHLTWYGHSAFLLEMDGQRVLIDPMLGPVASPVSFGSKRFPYESPIPLEELTDIDAVILSHDHYDHLDYPTITAIKDEVGHFYTALGVGSHLKRWGVPAEKITELDWWQDSKSGTLKLTACPARHFSGRGLGDRNATQWASWVIDGAYQKLYFSGDSGYGPHFSEIGAKYGPFDLAMMECGQYNAAWAAIHMMPEESVQAGIDVGGGVLMPIHWGAFKLSIHSWTDPIQRFQKAGVEKGVSVIHPFIGERFQVGLDMPTTEWWKE